MVKIPVVRKVLEANDAIAEELRELFAEKGLAVLNIVGSPGAGKTALIEKTLQRVGERMRIGVIEGDLATSLDAERIASHGVPVVQINTGGYCHLDAAMIKKALTSLNISGRSLLLIENVGNLVCPAAFDLGEALKVVISSVPEGDDKPVKYPSMFSRVGAVVLNKIDLLQHVRFDVEAFRRGLQRINADAPLIELSCETGQGLDAWLAWLERQVSA
jgi:hydrogenase nickel incorporation protein HypB